MKRMLYHWAILPRELTSNRCLKRPVYSFSARTEWLLLSKSNLCKQVRTTIIHRSSFLEPEWLRGNALKQIKRICLTREQNVAPECFCCCCMFINKPEPPLLFGFGRIVVLQCTPSRARTHNLCIRSTRLYPIELLAFLQYFSIFSSSILAAAFILGRSARSFCSRRAFFSCGCCREWMLLVHLFLARIHSVSFGLKFFKFLTISFIFFPQKWRIYNSICQQNQHILENDNTHIQMRLYFRQQQQKRAHALFHFINMCQICSLCHFCYQRTHHFDHSQLFEPKK